ncbi:hypothetical protein TW95_gp1104 [Pandoravirus inopinatum]|uniref:Uncharacterized protein n=1 Tax=Pandoravirus inopinatum TaxID=1605721 RepID=A0A0B5IYB3_9VIRU|nr:hypothetical protein TW95_gp1104 [Pandoravirus inopinatum]AJF97838.1 hypothetical protein [Pandoravirus inopinatum]
MASSSFFFQVVVVCVQKNVAVGLSVGSCGCLCGCFVRTLSISPCTRCPPGPRQGRGLGASLFFESFLCKRHDFSTEVGVLRVDPLFFLGCCTDGTLPRPQKKEARPLRRQALKKKESQPARQAAAQPADGR